jgi:hypothetical protein
MAGGHRQAYQYLSATVELSVCVRGVVPSIQANLLAKRFGNCKHYALLALTIIYWTGDFPEFLE